MYCWGVSFYLDTPTATVFFQQFLSAAAHYLNSGVHRNIKKKNGKMLFFWSTSTFRELPRIHMSCLAEVLLKGLVGGAHRCKTTERADAT